MYSHVSRFLQKNKIFSDWRDFRRLIDTIINEKPKHIWIPALIGECYECNKELLVPASTCLTLAYTSIILIDDLLDGDGRFSKHACNPPQLANMSAAMVAAAYQSLLSIPLSDKEKICALSILGRMLINVAHGQHLDTGDVTDESTYWEIVRLKSGAFFAGALGLGGVACGVDAEEVGLLIKLGEEYGILIQIHDDLRDSLEVPANTDWGNGRHPLPILFAETVEHPWRDRFNSIRTQVEDSQLLHEAQEILLRCGAISYGLYQIENHYDSAMQLLHQLKMKNNAPLVKVLDELVHPVDQLIKGLSEEG